MAGNKRVWFGTGRGDGVKRGNAGKDRWNLRADLET